MTASTCSAVLAVCGDVETEAAQRAEGDVQAAGDHATGKHADEPFENGVRQERSARHPGDGEAGPEAEW